MSFSILLICNMIVHRVHLLEYFAEFGHQMKCFVVLCIINCFLALLYGAPLGSAEKKKLNRAHRIKSIPSVS